MAEFEVAIRTLPVPASAPRETRANWLNEDRLWRLELEIETRKDGGKASELDANAILLLAVASWTAASSHHQFNICVAESSLSR